MNKPSNVIDTSKTAATQAPRLSLTRERIRHLRVQTGCKTGGSPVIITHATINVVRGHGPVADRCQ